MSTIADCLRQSARLAGLSDSARLDVEVLLAWVLKKDRSYLFGWPEKALGAAEQQQFDALLARRERGEPVAHIVGEREFWSLALYTDASTLIPRPDTEILVEQSLALLTGKGQRVLDLGTGSGAIAIAIASERADCVVEAVDKSAAAIALAARNVARHKLNNIALYQSDWFAAVRGQFNVIVSNPPYIDAGDQHLARGDLRFEPRSALVAADAGLADINHIVARARAHAFLAPGGWLLIEHGWQQKAAVQALFRAQGYRNVKTLCDYSGNDRLTLGRQAA